MNIQQQEKALKQLNGWELISSFSVGGFEYFGLSKKYPNKVIIIASLKNTILDCDTGLLQECEVEYDEKSFLAICDTLEDDFSISGQYGGTISHRSRQGDCVDIRIVGRTMIGDKELQIQQITFIDKFENGIIIYCGYPIYVCGFSYDGNYFVFADDGWIYVLKRI